MTEPIEWMGDGTPYSPRFGDRYHSENGGLSQSRQVFLAGCGLPAAWAQQPQWRILETGFGFGLNFLVTWAAWRADPQRPRMLHFVSTEIYPVSAADMLRAAPTSPELAPLAQQLHKQFWGLLPGVHRLSFEGGQVLLTLCIGDAQTWLRRQQLQVDSVYLDGFSPQRNPDLWNLHTFKAIARCCRRGTQLATWTIARAVRDGLSQCGFIVSKVPGVPPKRDNLHALFNPAWQPRNPPPAPPAQGPSSCIVIGAGLAGATVAASLARRGWQVKVLDTAEAPASGASGLPVGLCAPHISPDDSQLSRLSRCGLRTTRQQLQMLLQEGTDWSPTGVLEYRMDGTPGLPAPATAAQDDWSHAASAEQIQAAGLLKGANAYWHQQAGWVRPGQWIQALLATPGVHWQGRSPVAQLQRLPDPQETATPNTTPGKTHGEWQALDAQGQLLAQAAFVVIAVGPQSSQWLPKHWTLQPVRGQVSWGWHGETDKPAADNRTKDHTFPPFPVNGHGHLMTQIPARTAQGEAGHFWLMGSTFERDRADLPPSPEDQHQAHAENWQKLNTLLPHSAEALRPAFAKAPAEGGNAPPDLHHWAGVRCTAPDRLPVVGPVHAEQLPGLWVSTALGARGITLSMLCAELLAARLLGEPLPLDSRLAQALASERLG